MVGVHDHTAGKGAGEVTGFRVPVVTTPPRAALEEIKVVDAPDAMLDLLGALLGGKFLLLDKSNCKVKQSDFKLIFSDCIDNLSSLILVTKKK